MAKPIDPTLLELFDIQPKKSDLRKIEIINAAIESLAQYGLDGTTLDVIGKKLKISRSHVAYYFPEKDKIFEAVILFITGSIRKVTDETLEKAKTPEQMLQATAESLFIWSDRYPDHAKLMLLFYFQCCYNGNYRALNTQHRSARFQRIKGILDQMPRKNLVFGSNTEELAKAIQVLLYGYLQEYLTTDAEGRTTEVRDLPALAVKACLALAS